MWWDTAGNLNFGTSHFVNHNAFSRVLATWPRHTKHYQSGVLELTKHTQNRICKSLAILHRRGFCNQNDAWPKSISQSSKITSTSDHDTSIATHSVFMDRKRSQRSFGSDFENAIANRSKASEFGAFSSELNIHKVQENPEMPQHSKLTKKKKICQHRVLTWCSCILAPQNPTVSRIGQRNTQIECWNLNRT